MKKILLTAALLFSAQAYAIDHAASPHDIATPPAAKHTQPIDSEMAKPSKMKHAVDKPKSPGNSMPALSPHDPVSPS